jgi:hypothetical protein
VFNNPSGHSRENGNPEIPHQLRNDRINTTVLDYELPLTPSFEKRRNQRKNSFRERKESVR